MNSSFAFAQVPVVVAVTGHRDIPVQDIPVLSKVVSAHLREISKAYPDSPCLLLSGLAEGADRLVAHCALDQGWQLAAVLPMRQSNYEADFSDEGSVKEFRALLARSVWVRELGGGSTTRPDCYRVLGDWLARQAQVLIALWDGGPGNGIGGTADVVTTFREGLPTAHLYLPDSGPVIHVQTRRLNAPIPAGSTPVGLVTHLPASPAGMGSEGEETRWKAIFARINQFNCDSQKTDVQSQLHSPAPPTGTPYSEEPGHGRYTNNTSAGLAWSLYQAADLMSFAAQKKRDLIFRGLLSLSAVAILFAQVYSNLFGLPLLLGSALALSGGGFLWYSLVAGRQLEQRYLDYRALAEACKVQYFWKLVGIEACAADFFLRDQRDELEWIRQALQVTEMGLPTEPTASLEQRLQLVRGDWIDDQVRYFLGNLGPSSGKAAFNRIKDALWSKRSQRLFEGGMVLTLLTFLFHLIVADPANDVHGWILKVMILGYSLVFASAGLTKVYQQTRAFSEHAKQYQRMGFKMLLARSRLDKALSVGDTNLALKVVQAIGIEALSENGNWLLIHRDRPVSAQGIG